MRTTRLFTELTKGKLYRFTYRVQNVNGWSELADITYIRAAIEPSKPEPPLLVQATATTIDLKFYKPADNGGAEISQFQLYRNDGDIETLPSIQVTSYNTNLLTHQLTVIDDSLETGKIYKFVFRAINAVGDSLDSNIASYALCDVPLAPSEPTVMLSHTNESQIAVEWPAVASLQSPGSDITGYLLEMKDTRDLYGVWEVVYDGSDSYPDWRNF